MTSEAAHKFLLCDTASRALAALIGAIMLTARMGALASPNPPTQTNDDFQTWDEIDVTAPLDGQLALTWVSWVRSNAQGPLNHAYGAEAEMNLSSHLTLSPSYWVYDSYKSANRQWVETRQPTLAVTLSEALQPCDLLVRNRLSEVDGGSASYEEYRIRPQVGCRVSVEPLQVSVFLWDELFYYSQYHRWTRNRVAPGFRVDCSQRWAFELYYLHQYDEESRPREVNAVGVTLQLRVGPSRSP
jgi:hypothetical protein